jgi:putative tryptophan/tyrosine transport system substrate-binding protein
MLAVGTVVARHGTGVAQTSRVPVVGVLRANAKATELFVERFRRDLEALGWDEGRNIALVTRWAEGHNDRLPALARELIARPVDIIVAFGDPGIRAVQRATRSVPTVAMADDVVGSGLVASMARPGGNITGVSIFAKELDVKRLELLREAVPQARRVGILADHTRVSAARIEFDTVARGLRVDVAVFVANSRDEIVRALAAMIAARVDAVNVLASPILQDSRDLIIERLGRARLPAIYQWPETAIEDGGLMAYGPRIALVYRQVAHLVDKILRGARPSDLPIEQPKEFALVINRRTAKRLGLTIPDSLLVRANQVIE